MTLPAVSQPAPYWSLTEVPWLAGRGRLSQSIHLEERAPSGLVFATIAIMALMVGGFLTWASLTYLGEVASASGEITSVGTVRRIQHLEGGIVAAIRVREGDQVEAGAPLIELEQGTSLPELEQMQGRLASLDAQRAQLLAFRNGAGGASIMPAGRFEAMALSQAELLGRKRAAIRAQEALLEEQVRQRRTERETLLVQSARVQDQLDLIGEQVSTRSGLVDKGLSARMGLLDLQREQARVRASKAEVDGQAARAEIAIREAEARIAELLTRSHKEVAEELAKNEADSAELRETMARASDRVQRLVIRAPVAGTVKGLQTETIGGVIAPGSTVMELIPRGCRSSLRRGCRPRISASSIGAIRPR
jgi:adhesin transport system membrane fusion protein